MFAKFFALILALIIEIIFHINSFILIHFFIYL